MRPTLLVADAGIEPDDPTTLAMRAVGFDVVSVCHSATDVADAAAHHRPDLALVARHLPGDGFTAIAHLIVARPDVNVVLRCADLDDGDLVAALRLGVRGILPAHLDLRALSSSMLAVRRGETVIPRDTSARALSAAQQREAAKRVAAESPLTAREWEILELLATGASTADIAGVFALAPGTVRTHISTLRRKLGVRPGAGVVAAPSDPVGAD